MPWDDMQATIKKKLGTKPSKPEMGMIESPTGEMRAPRNLNERGTAMGIDRGGNFTPDRIMAAIQLLASSPLMPAGEVGAGGSMGIKALMGGSKVRTGANILKTGMGWGGPSSKAAEGGPLADVIKAMRRQMTGMKPPGVK